MSPVLGQCGSHPSASPPGRLPGQASETGPGDKRSAHSTAPWRLRPGGGGGRRGVNGRSKQCLEENGGRRDWGGAAGGRTAGTESPSHREGGSRGREDPAGRAGGVPDGAAWRGLTHGEVGSEDAGPRGLRLRSEGRRGPRTCCSASGPEAAVGPALGTVRRPRRAGTVEAASRGRALGRCAVGLRSHFGKEEK